MKRSDTMGPDRWVRVWDPLVRLFHWSLAGFFLIAYLTEDDWLDLHSVAGYAVVGLLLFRVAWGFIGTRHARFTDFVASPGTVGRYLGSLLRGQPAHYEGHNPAGGLMILLMLVVLALTCFTGVVTLASEGLGPLSGTFLAGLSEELFEELHEGLANLMLGLVVVHVAGVLVSSLAHHENLVRAMITGRKRARQEQG
ncbi:cytochrome b/b6 domain-containing protein [Motiliproteus sp. SC1-56]|uniref:cytochrome b/b6 domain-containing protein n=1 Tax=Motiliproteus sp. SC1-56 TaxID=2799565 RepID=UPI001F5E1563|nr:cytochrome b/b6 domain-containing protein [Motiliproteus sp. SC1-56]